MHIFNDDISNILQYVSLFLEIIGITLAFIEIKSPKIARFLEESIHDFENHLKDLGSRIASNKITQNLVTVFIVLLLIAIIPALWGLFELPSFVWIIFFFIGAVFLFIIGVFLLVAFIDSLNSFSNGRAIGSLGICLASLGLFGEIYQILNIWFGFHG